MMQKIIFFFFTLILFLSCKNNKGVPDVSHIQVDATIQRLDNDFFNASQPLPQRLENCSKKYGNLFDFYLFKTGVTDMAAASGSVQASANEFTNLYKNIYDSTQKLYKKIDWLENDFKKSFQLYKYYFPEFKVPKLFSIVDAFTPDDAPSYYGIFYEKDTLLISLQMFLGKGFSAYDPKIYYDYMQERFTKDYILKNALTAIINKQFPVPNDDEPMIEQFIDAGKRIYLLENIMPYAPDEIKFGYKKKQLADCSAKEKDIWAYFISNDLLFKTEPTIIKEYLGENPFTKEMGTESPGNIGAFVGYQIVKKYLTNQKNMTPAQLMKVDSKVIYRDAKYKP
jgi:hypothetical protein